MKILVAHNAYLHRGGEDAVVDAEVALLRAHGHEVALYQRNNDELHSMSRPAAALSTIWSRRTTTDLDRLCDVFQPDVIHAHNTLALISPSLYWQAARRKLPVVQTLHNFRLLCPQAMLLREGKACEDCIGKLPWRAVTRKCYRDSSLQSAVLGGMLATHRAIGTFRHKVTRYIALNRFCRDKFIAGGLPADRLTIKPHFVNASESPQWAARKGGLFIGRLSPEKGLDLLIKASGALGASEFFQFQVIGSGPLELSVRQAFGANYLGTQSNPHVRQLLRNAAFLVAPSTCYETFGLVAIEAFSCGTPVIASAHGGLGELVTDGVTGLLFKPGDAADLARKITWAREHPNEMLQMGRQAYADYRARYTPERNHTMLIEIYDDAMASVETLHEGTRHAA